MAITYLSVNGKEKLVSVKQLAEMERYKGIFPESVLRRLIAEGNPRLNSRGHIISGNGILESGAIIRVGRRIIIDVAAFDKWLVAYCTRKAEAKVGRSHGY